MAFPTAANMIDCLVLAEFDIDTGSKVKVQYPENLGCDAGYLAEMMLPDGADKRDRDMTVFRVEEKAGPRIIGQPFETFLYEFDENSEQGWVEKGIHIMRLYPNIIHVSAPNDPDSPTYSIRNHAELDYTQLEPLFSCVLTDTGRALGFRFGADNDEAAFCNQVQALKANEPAEEGEVQVFWCVNAVSVQRRGDVRRGAVVKAVGIVQRECYIQAWTHPLQVLIDQLQATDSIEEETALLAMFYDTWNGMDRSILADYPYILRSIFPTDCQTVSLTLNGTPMDMRFPLSLLPGQNDLRPIQWLWQKFGAQTTHIINAVLMEKRVLFLAYEATAWDVVRAVYAVQAMCNQIPDLAARCHPYRNLTTLDFVSQPGFIAGVCNPMFEQHSEWWDICCSCDSGKVTLGAAVMDSFEKQPHSKADAEFAALIENKLEYATELSLLAACNEYISHLLLAAMDCEEYDSPQAKQSDADTNASRFQALKGTASFATFRESYHQEVSNGPIGSNARRCVRQMINRKALASADMATIFKTLIEYSDAEGKMLALISLFPVDNHLFMPSLGLFHEDQLVRALAVTFFEKLQSYSITEPLFSRLNSFLYLGFNRG